MATNGRTMIAALALGVLAKAAPAHTRTYPLANPLPPP